MKIHLPVKIFASLAVCAIASLIIAPAPTEAQFDPATLLTVLAVKWAFDIGAELGQASRQNGKDVDDTNIGASSLRCP